MSTRATLRVTGDNIAETDHQARIHFARLFNDRPFEIVDVRADAWRRMDGGVAFWEVDYEAVAQ